MKLVYLESPYAGDVAGNLKYANACIRDSFLRGEAPFVSHILYTTALDDLKPDERRQGMEAGFEWAKVAKATVVYIDRGISPGMAEGIERAIKAGRPIEWRKLGHK